MQSAYIERTFNKFNCRSDISIVGLQSLTSLTYEEYVEFKKHIARTKFENKTLCTYGPFVWKISTLRNWNNKFPYFVLFPFNLARSDGRHFNNIIESYQSTSWSKFYKYPIFIFLQHIRIIQDTLKVISTHGNTQSTTQVIALVQNSLINYMSDAKIKNLNKSIQDIQEYLKQNDNIHNLFLNVHPVILCKTVLRLFEENKDYLFDYNDIDLFYVAIARIDSKWIYHKISNLNIKDKKFYTREAYLNAEKLKAEVLEYLWEKSKNDLIKLFFVFYFCNKINKIPTSGINQIYENLNKMIKISYDKNLSELLSMMGINNVNDVLEIFIEKFLCNDGLIGATFEDYHQHMKRTYEVFLKNFLLDIQDYRGEDISFVAS